MTLRERTERFVKTWEPSLAEEFFRYDHLLCAKFHHPPADWGHEAAEPYWKELPRWLNELGGKSQGAVSPEILEAVLWGQTSLFYAIRLMDDLFDGGLSRSPLAFASLLFLREADQTYASVFDVNAGFWRHYRQSLETTAAGIVRVARMQRDPAACADELLQAYGCVDAVLSVAALAVCEQMEMADSISRIKVFVSEMGKVLLTLDDLEDIEEDLADGRMTYPARILLDRSIASGASPLLLVKSWRQEARVAGFDEIKEKLLGCLSRASEDIAPLGLQDVMAMIERTKAAVEIIG